MTNTDQSNKSKDLVNMAENIAQGYTNTGTGALGGQLESINAGLGRGESPLISSAFTAQRTGLTNALAGQAQGAKQSQLEGSKKAMSGGNEFANLSPADIGSKLANALFGSKFEEGQADISQKMNLMNMALGGAGTAGNAGLNAGQTQLSTIGYAPNYNQNYANILGAASAGGSIFGAYQNWAANQQPSLPMGTSYSSFVGSSQ